MRYISLLLIAWIVNWLVMPAPGGSEAGTDFVGSALGALGIALLFSFMTWLYLRKHHPNNPSLLLTPTFVMIGMIALLGFGLAYGAARDSGLDPTSATLSALAGWPGIFGLFAVMGSLAWARKPAGKHDI